MKKPFLLLILVLTSLSFTACIDDNTIPTTLPPITSDSFINVLQKGTIEEISTKLEASLIEKNFNLPAFSPINHDSAAANIDLTLRPTRLYIFGNPKAGTLLMQEDQRIGIDLPLKMLAYTDNNDNNLLGFYTATTLAKRYEIQNTNLIKKIDSTLFIISGIDPTASFLIKEENSTPLKEKESAQDLDTTISQLKTAITTRDFKIIGEIAHDQAAEAVDLTLRPTRLFIFGKPQGGTVLMQSDQRTGIDLPLKILIYEDKNGLIKVSYYSSDFLANRYQIKSENQVLDNIKNALEAITDEAIK